MTESANDTALKCKPTMPNLVSDLDLVFQHSCLEVKPEFCWSEFKIECYDTTQKQSV